MIRLYRGFIGNYYNGLYRDYYKDPSLHSKQTQVHITHWGYIGTIGI